MHLMNCEQRWRKDKQGEWYHHEQQADVRYRSSQQNSFSVELDDNRTLLCLADAANSKIYTVTYDVMIVITKMDV